MSETKSVEMALTQDGTFQLDTLDRQMAYAQSLMQKGLISDTYKNPSQVVLAIQMAKVMGVDPIIALKQSYVQNGKPMFFGDLPLAVVMASGMVEHFREYFITEECKEICVKNKNLKEKAWAAVCESKRRGTSGVIETYFSLDDAGIAGLLRNPTWNKYSRDMLMYRARIRNLKTLFAEKLNGVDTEALLLGTDEKETEQERAKSLTERYSTTILAPEPVQE